MKKLTILLTIPMAICLFCLGCHQVPTIESANSEKYDVCFRLQMDVSILPFPDSKSIPDTFPPEPGIEEGSIDPSTPESPVFEYLYYAVINTDTQEMYDEFQLSKGDGIDDFGKYLYLSLPPGSYQLTIVTHSSAEASSAGNLFLLEDLSDTFLGLTTFEVKRNHSLEEMTVSMTRRVSRVEFVPTDDVPDEVKEFHIIVPERYITINLLTGVCVPAKSDYLYKYFFSEEEKTNKKKITHWFYTFVPEEVNAKLPQVVLVVKGEEEEALWQKLFRTRPYIEIR